MNNEYITITNMNTTNIQTDRVISLRLLVRAELYITKALCVCVPVIYMTRMYAVLCPPVGGRPAVTSQYCQMQPSHEMKARFISFYRRRIISEDNIEFRWYKKPIVFVFNSFC